MTNDDVEYVHQIRNNFRTAPYLHDDTIYSLEQCKKWYKESKPKWYIIYNGKDRVGYFRTADETETSIQIGADIHPRHRGKGYATEAYIKFIGKLHNEGKTRIWLEVLSNNINAIGLYRKLGFQVEGRRRDHALRDGQTIDSLVMSHKSSRTEKHVKIVTTYLGDRRRPPRNSGECLKALKRSWHYEQTVNPGVGMDTIYINSVPSVEDKVSNKQELKICYDFLHSLDGKQTAGGTAKVIDRENMGMSFGSYNFAFEQFNDVYDYFCLIEDDHVIVKDGYYRTAKMQLENNANLGFVALVKINSRPQLRVSFAAGAVGFTTSRILKQAYDLNGGKLPHYDQTTGITTGDYALQKKSGEYEFTGLIYSMGYTLEMISMEQCCSCWGANRERTDRMVVLPT
jgi:RimJ/RimL family protein N-acetyltransferase